MATPFAPSGRLELVIFSCGGEPQRHRLPVVGQLRIGRSRTTNDVVISDASVSANHAVLTVDSRIYIQDLGSLNGTILRKGNKDMDITHTEQAQRLTGDTFVVEPGDRIVLGSVMGMLRTICLPSNANASDADWPYPPVVQHPVMQSLYAEARKVAASASRACVLLLGETGVGKDMLAKTIHAASSRAKGPFMEMNCGGIMASVAESALFGHKRGAFTGATSDAKGYFDAAHGGTLFMDEVGELSLDMQVKLLKVLDNQRITPMGTTESHQVNVRVIAATNKNLHDCVMAGTFRRDLLYRLQGFELEIPPLRSRPMDIIPLAEAFIEHECRVIGQAHVPHLSAEVISLLEGYDFPGNVRQLRHAMMRAVAYCCSGGAILPEHLPKAMREYDKTDRMEALPFEVPDQMADLTVVMPDQVPENALEKERIRWALHQCGGNVTRAAEVLGMSRRKLFYLLKKKYPDLPRARPNLVALRANH